MPAAAGDPTKVPLPPSIVRALGRQREPLLTPLERALGLCARGRVTPQQRQAAVNGEKRHVHSPRAGRGWQRDHHCPRAPLRRRLVECLPELVVRQRGHRLHDGRPERPSARTPEDLFERIVPEDHAAAAVDDTHALAERFDHFTTTAVIGAAIEIVVVRSIHRHEWEKGNHEHFPRPVMDHLDQANSDAGPDDVTRTDAEQGFRPRAIDRPFRKQRQDEIRRSAGHDAVRERSGCDRRGLPWPVEGGGRAAEQLMHRCRRDRCDDDGRGVHDVSPKRMCDAPPHEP
jgi:hypothetical protein